MVPGTAWSRAYKSDGIKRDGAWVADITGMLDLSSWPAGIRIVVRKEIPHVGAQLRITNVDIMRYTALATNQEDGQLADLEVRHRLRARYEDRIRNAKVTGLANLPLHSFAGNTLRCRLVMLAADLTAWAQILALHSSEAKRWEPNKLEGEDLRDHREDLQARSPADRTPRQGSTGNTTADEGSYTSEHPRPALITTTAARH